jgi:inorganic pyrophosphatase
MKSTAPSFRAHPWHGVLPGPDAPTIVTCYVEIVPTDTMKYEVDKETGILRLDRPQKFSNHCPTVYGFIPRTLCGDGVGDLCAKATRRRRIKGDGDAMDICVLTSRPIVHSDIILHAKPIGGFRMIDGGEADDKIVAVLENDDTYGDLNELKAVPRGIIDRLHHYFLTYKQVPGLKAPPRVEVSTIYDRKTAHGVIRQSILDYAATYSLAARSARKS